MRDDEGHGFGFQLARVARRGPVASPVEQFMRVLVRQDEKLLRGLKASQDLTAPAI